MNINYVLDQDGGIDPTDPLGDLEFIDEAGNRLILRDTFIDVWLTSLLKSLTSYNELNNAAIEVLEEPYKIKATLEGEVLKLDLDGQAVEASTEGMVSAIKSASERLIAELSKFKGFENNATLKELESVLNVPSKSPF